MLTDVCCCLLSGCVLHHGPAKLHPGGSRGGSHLAYKLDIPAQPGEAQAVLGIKAEGSFALSAKVRRSWQGRCTHGVANSEMLGVAVTR